MSEFSSSSSSSSDQKLPLLVVSELMSLLSFALSNPLYFSYLLFFSPYLYKLFSFLSPLFATTFLLLLSLAAALRPTPILSDDHNFQFQCFEESEVYKIVFHDDGDDENRIIFSSPASFDYSPPENDVEVVKEMTSSIPAIEAQSRDDDVAIINEEDEEGDQSNPKGESGNFTSSVEKEKKSDDDVAIFDEEEDDDDQSKPEGESGNFKSSVEREKESSEYDDVAFLSIRKAVVKAKEESMLQGDSGNFAGSTKKSDDDVSLIAEEEEEFTLQGDYSNFAGSTKKSDDDVALIAEEEEEFTLQGDYSNFAGSTKKSDDDVALIAEEEEKEEFMLQGDSGNFSIDDDVAVIAADEEEEEEVKPKASSVLVKSKDSVDRTDEEEEINGGDHFESPAREDLSGSMRKEEGEKEWRRTLACKLFEERHNNGGEGMDLLWETHEAKNDNKTPKNDITKNKKPMRRNSTKSNSMSSITSNSSSSNSNKKKGIIRNSGEFGSDYGFSGDYGDNNDDDDDDDEVDDETNGKLCCLQALKFSAGKMSLGMGKPNLVKFSKALKGIGWFHSLTSKHSSNSKKRYDHIVNGTDVRA